MSLESPFPSFWLAGFDCASQVQAGRGRLDLTAELQHDRYCDDDYGMLAPFGFRTVRDGVRWHLIERRPGRYDFSTVEPLRQAARRHGLCVIWDICHFGWPRHVHPLQPDFPDRYARFAAALARYLRGHADGVCCYVPIVEMSFLASAAGEWGIFSPFARGQHYAVKCILARAAIAGMEAIWEVDPRARILHSEPLVHFVAPAGRPDLAQAARARNEGQFESLDMLAGYREPQLGGHPRYLDLLGFNYYPYSEQDVQPSSLLRSDPRWLDLSELLAQAYARYHRPLLIAETSGIGGGRGPWLEYVADEAARALQRSLPLQGICLYPITNAPNWDTDECQAYGLWDLVRRPDGRLVRVLNEPAAQALRAAQARLRPYLQGTPAHG